MSSVLQFSSIKLILEILNIATDVRSRIEDFKNSMDVLVALRNAGIKPRHLAEITEKTEIQLELDDINFDDLIKMGIKDHRDVIRDISERATKEFAIEETLRKMMDDWKTREFDILPYKNSGKVFCHKSFYRV